MVNFTPIRTKGLGMGNEGYILKELGKVKELWDGLDEYTIPVGTTSTGLYSSINWCILRIEGW